GLSAALLLFRGTVPQGLAPHHRSPTSAIGPALFSARLAGRGASHRLRARLCRKHRGKRYRRCAEKDACTAAGILAPIVARFREPFGRPAPFRKPPCFAAIFR